MTVRVSTMNRKVWLSFDVLVLIAAVGLGVADALAQILDDARALGDAPCGEHALAVQRRVLHADERFGQRAARCAHTATGALMGA